MGSVPGIACISGPGSRSDRLSGVSLFLLPFSFFLIVKMIDLRSDTVTKPSPEMRRTMAEAVVGDDVFMEDPTLNKLQDRAAAVFQREAALFVPSGSMGN